MNIIVGLMAALSLLHSPAPRTAPQRASRGVQRTRLDWAALRRCESHGNYSTDTGNGFFGAYQFSLGTWRSVGGAGNPAAATPDEQDHRAALLYQRSGRGQWPTCGRLL